MFRRLIVFDRFHLADLSVRVLAAPMAGGPSKPELVAAVANSGGLGFLASGLSSAEDLADDIFAARKLTSGVLGVNLLVPQQVATTDAQLNSFESALKPEASRYGATVGEPARHYDWDAKLNVIYDLRPEAVSFTFGSPTREQSRRLKSIGIMVLATVTTVREAMIALNCGADALVVQGPDAGGHRATFDPFAVPPDDSLDDLVSMLAYCFDYPIVAAGGLGTRRDVSRLRDAGAAAVQLGTAFLLADEAGTNPVHRAALVDPQFNRTVLTRAFTGRYGRALRNRFIDQHEPQAIVGFPQVAGMTASIQSAAVKRGDPHGAALWAGAAFRHAKKVSAADIVRELAA
jgi:nitronate monooxygenase